MSKNVGLQIGVLLAVFLANFVAQVPYTIHQYGVNRLFAASTGWMMMVAVFVLLLAGATLFLLRWRMGYWLLLLFVALDFLFYLGNIMLSIAAGYGVFFQLAYPDPLLRLVFGIGYLNFVAAGYCLLLLVARRRNLLYEWCLK